MPTDKYFKYHNDNVIYALKNCFQYDFGIKNQSIQLVLLHHPWHFQDPVQYFLNDPMCIAPNQKCLVTVFRRPPKSSRSALVNGAMRPS